MSTTTTESSNSPAPLTMPAVDTAVGSSNDLTTTVAPEAEASSSLPSSSAPGPFSPSIPTDSRPGKPRSHLNQARARAQIVELRSSLQFSDPVQRRRAAEAMETLKFKDPNLRLSSKADKENKPAKSFTIKKVEVSSADQGIALNAEQRTVVQKLLHFEDGHRAKLTQLRLEYENIARAFSTRFFAEKQRADVLQHQLLNAQDQLTQVHTSFAMLGAGQNERLQLLEQENAGLSLALRQTRLELQVVLQNVSPYLPGFSQAPTAQFASVLPNSSVQAAASNVSVVEMKPANRRTSKTAFAPSTVDSSTSQSRNRSTSAAPLRTATSYNRIKLQSLVEALPQLQARGAFPHSVSSPVLPGTPETGVSTSELRPRADTAPSLLPALELRKVSGGASKMAAAGLTAAKSNPALDALTSAFKITSVSSTPANNMTPAAASTSALASTFALPTNAKVNNTSSGNNNKGTTKSQRATKAKPSSRSVSGPVKIPSEDTENLPPTSDSMVGSEKDNWRRPGGGKGKARRATFSRSQRRSIMGDKLNDESMLKIIE